MRIILLAILAILIVIFLGPYSYNQAEEDLVGVLSVPEASISGAEENRQEVTGTGVVDGPIPQDWQLYDAAFYNFYYPPSLVVEDEGLNGAALKELSTDEKTTKKDLAFFQTDAFEQDTFRHEAENLIKQAERRFESPNVSSLEDIQLNTFSGYTFTILTPSFEKHYILEIEKQRYLHITNYTEDDHPQNATVNKVIGSLTLD